MFNQGVIGKAPPISLSNLLKMKIGKNNKIILEEYEVKFIKENHGKMTNRKMADALGLKLTTLRTKCYEMGLYQMRLQYWTPEQVDFLKANYKKFGDTELAEIFEVKWFKDKGWSKKHIEKKRRYLKLKRTLKHRKTIHDRNTAMGRFSECAKKRWESTGQTPIGFKRVWFTSENKPFVVVKTKQGFVHYNRHLWEKHHGKIPAKTNVCIREGADIINYGINDLVLLSDAELAVQNSKNRNPLQLKETKKVIRQIEKLIIKSNENE